MDLPRQQQDEETEQLVSREEFSLDRESVGMSESESLLEIRRSKRAAKMRKIARKILRLTRANLLLILIVIGVLAGVVVGIAAREAHPSDTTILLIAFPGDIFLRSLKMLILPLIVFSLIAGLGSLNVRTAGTIGGFTLLYYAVTTTLAVAVGLILVISIHPGNSDSLAIGCTNQSQTRVNDLDTLDSFLDLARNLIPDNLFGATLYQTKTEYRYEYVKDWASCADSLGINTTNMNCSMIVDELVDQNCDENVIVKKSRVLVHTDGMNILGIITFTIAFSIALGLLEKGQVIIGAISILNEAIMKLIAFIMWSSPVGIASIIAGKLLEIDDLSEVLAQLGMFMLVVLLGLFIHGCITLPLIFIIFARKNPFKFLSGIVQAMLVAFGTSSSSITLPVTMQCLEDNLGYDKRVTRFMLPVGATVNMDGTALYEAVAAVFIAQINNLDTDPAKIVVIAITATAASVGAAGVPQAGLVTLLIVLTAIGLPTTDIALILAIDWLLDRCRTTVNVFGDCVGVAVVQKIASKQLSSAPPPAGSAAITASSPSSLELSTSDIDNKPTKDLTITHAIHDSPSHSPAPAVKEHTESTDL